MSTATPVPEPTPEEVARGIIAIEQHLAAAAPAVETAPPAVGELADVALDDGETRRVRQMRARVAEAHQLLDLQQDAAPLLVDTGKVSRRRAKVAEAATLHRLAQDPAALAFRDQRVRKVTTVMTMTAAGIALAVSSIGVQASVVTALGLEHGTAGWWAAFGVEPALSLPLLAAVGVQAYSAMRGAVVDRRSPAGRTLARTEAVGLALTLILNCWPAFAGGFDPLTLIVHALGPVAAVTAVWVLPALWQVLELLPVSTAPTGGPTGRKYRENEPTAEERHRARLHELIAAGSLSARPSATAIRDALGCGSEIASRLRDELAGGAS